MPLLKRAQVHSVYLKVVCPNMKTIIEEIKER